MNQEQFINQSKKMKSKINSIEFYTEKNLYEIVVSGFERILTHFLYDKIII